MHDFPASHIDGAHHRREAAPKPKEMRPLLTREPLPQDRERKPASQPPKKRKRVVPTTPVFSFDPKRSHVPSGRQDPPASPSVCSRPSTSDSSASSYDEQTTPFPDHEIHDQVYNGYDAQKRPRIFPDCPSVERSTSFCPDTPCTGVNAINSVASPDIYPSCPLPSSPAPSDQSPCAAEFAFQVMPPMYVYSGQEYAQPPVVQDHYGYACLDRPVQGYPIQCPDATYSRPASHGVPVYSEHNGYSYPPGRRG